jgi:replication factor C large subunit
MLDEIDGISGKDDRGGVKELVKILKTTQNPIVLTANDAYNPRLSTIRKYCLVIPFKNPTVRQVISHLKRITKKEEIDVSQEAFEHIANGRDVRSAVNDLQATAQGKKNLSVEEVQWLGWRDRKEEIFQVLQKIIYSKDGWEIKKTVMNSDVDPDMLFNWIYENTPYHLTNPHDLVRAMDFLSLADIYRKRIRETQYWSLLRYVRDFMTLGVTTSRVKSKTLGWIPFRFPEKIRMLSRTKGERAFKKAVGMKIRKKCHISATSSIKEFIPYLKIIFENNPKMAAGLSRWFDFDEDMIEFLAQNKKNSKLIFTEMKSPKI